MAIFHFWQNGTFEPLHEIQFILPRAFFWSIMKLSLIKHFQKSFQGPPNPWLRSGKVQKQNFLKKILLQILLNLGGNYPPLPHPNPTGSAGPTGIFFQSYSWTLVSSIIGSLSSVFSAIIRSAFVLSSITYLKRNNITFDPN